MQAPPALSMSSENELPVSCFSSEERKRKNQILRYWLAGIYIVFFVSTVFLLRFNSGMAALILFLVANAGAMMMVTRFYQKHKHPKKATIVKPV